MHSSRMHTTCSSSCLQYMLGYTPSRCGAGRPTWVWAWRSSRCGPGDLPKARPLNFTPGVGLETPRPDTLTSPLGVSSGDPPGQTTQAPPGCGPGNLQDMLGYHPHPLETSKACWDTTCKACWDITSPCEQNHRQM